MKKVIIILVLSIVLGVVIYQMLTSFDIWETSSQGTPTQSVETSSTEAPQKQEQAQEQDYPLTQDASSAPPSPIHILAAYIPDEHLYAYEPYTHYIDEPAPQYPVNVAFTSDNPVEIFSYVGGEMKFDKEDDFWFEVQEVLYTPDILDSGNAFIATTEFYGALPHRAIMYEDEHGKVRVFSINMSGQSEYIALVEEEYTISYK